MPRLKHGSQSFSQKSSRNSLRQRRSSRRVFNELGHVKQEILDGRRECFVRLERRIPFVRLERRIPFVSLERLPPNFLQPAVNNPIPPQPAPHVPFLQPPAPVPARRRRHALVPHKVTYRHGLNIDPVHLENVCTNGAHFLGELSDICPHDSCRAKFFQGEFSNRQGIRLFCCMGGEVAVVDRNLDCPPYLRHLLSSEESECVRFRENIRAANSLFAMASFQTTLPNHANVNVGQGHWCFVVCGQVHHYTCGAPATQERQQPILNQYYFIDAGEAIDRRVDFLEDRLFPQTVKGIELLLRQINPYVKAYRSMREVIEELQELEANHPTPARRRVIDNVILTFHENMNRERRNFNLPESRSDIAAVFYGEEPPFNVDLKLYPRSRGVHNELKNLNRLCDPMVYPLLFPYGDFGFDCKMVHRIHSNRKVTCREFYCFKLQIRDGFSLLHNSGKLFQQYIVDAWVRIESDRLWWLRQNQQHLIRVSEGHARRQLERRANALNARVGKIVILPPSFEGSSKQKHRQFLEAMAIVARHGKPDLFITFTCNPHWVEIQSNLSYKQKFEHRPDLVCRVFHAKLTEFIDDIVNKQYYGVVLNYMYVIEVQKRGLPHAHILVTLMAEDKFDNDLQVDSIISAQLPDPQSQPLLFDIVSSNMIHRKCGNKFPDAPCMKEGKCKKFFPKDFRNSTSLNTGSNQRPEYRRPADGRSFVNSAGHLVDNRWVIPYNPYAVAKYNCHINFEVCGSLRSIKYLHKYVQKGADFATFEIQVQGNNDRVIDFDEIKQYLDCRYVSSFEAVWRIFGYKMHDRSHSVVVLPVHLPNERDVLLRAEDDEQEFQNVLNKSSKLEAWFNLNSVSVFARRYSYSDIPEHFRWDSKNGEWVIYKKNVKSIGTLVDVSPIIGQMELFYLKLLLLHIKGATSYEFLRTVQGTLHPTFESACRALNLLVNTDEYERCLNEAALKRHPYCLRTLFAHLCCVLEGEHLGEIPALWLRFVEDFIDDFLHNGIGRNQAIAKAFLHVKTIVDRNKGESFIGKLGIEVNVENIAEEEHGNQSQPSAVINELFLSQHVAVAAAVQQQYSLQKLNANQLFVAINVLRAIQRVLGIIVFGPSSSSSPSEANNGCFSNYASVAGLPQNHQRTNVFYLDGPGGTGKTYLYNTLISYVQNILHKPTIAVAWTGIAASLLIGGTTAHKAFHIPLNCDENSVAGWAFDSKFAEDIKKCP